jgi:ATP-dependent DNA helicase RecQ
LLIVVWKVQNRRSKLTDQVCPVCSSPMVVRTARRGKNAGGQFWGCSDFPNCKSIVEYKIADGRSEKSPIVDLEKSEKNSYPVIWYDNLKRNEYFSEYLTISAIPGFLNHLKLSDLKTVRNGISQSLMLTKRLPPQDTNKLTITISSVIQKILSRGDMPLCTLSVENNISEKPIISNNIKKFDDREQEIGWHWSGNKLIGLSSDIASVVLKRRPLKRSDVTKFENSVLEDVFDSPNETYFFTKWIFQHFGEEAAHWFMPQTPLDLLLQSKSPSDAGARRIDFLFFHPSREPLAIELDGDDHAQKTESDSARDEALAGIGINTIRIPNAEIVTGEGPNLEAVKSFISGTFDQSHNSGNHNEIGTAVMEATASVKFQFILAKALGTGKLDLSLSHWTIKVRSDATHLNLFQSAAEDFRSMLSSLRYLYEGVEDVPQIEIISDDSNYEKLNLSVGVFSYESPLSLYGSNKGEDYLVCPACVPVKITIDTLKTRDRLDILGKNDQLSEKHLTFFLQNLFRKRKFRDLQPQAILNTLKKKDTVTLLPTGAGKSIIYQLAGLLQPGITLVIDPIVALIEDQIQGLLRVGIDKVGSAPSGVRDTRERQSWLRSIERGDSQFILISPERLQMVDFRETLRSIVEVNFINLAVIDEAHCVSEWGHNFRFSYLNLAENLRRFCTSTDGYAPTLLALTGTASRAVLRELLVELGISKDDDEALIRPLEFDRHELKFNISKVNHGGDTSSVLRGIINSLPNKFNMPPSEFFKSAGDYTNSGIIFTPFVNGRTHGLFSVKSSLQQVVKTPVTVFSGSAPKGVERNNWEVEKRKNANDFKSNLAPILVATKAFGMGIDKPNIRWTIHMGVPSSMEAFYQEAGRAGRDKNLAYCNLIFSEVDPDQTDEALAAQDDIEDLRNAAAKMKSNNDDVSRALFFHLNAFSGVDEEIQTVSNVLQKLGTLENRSRVEISYGNANRADIERAILRLKKTGIVDDLEVQYGSRIFNLSIRPFDFQFSRSKVETYIRESQPARLKQIMIDLDNISNLERSEQVLELCNLMIKFTYDVIERSRRRMLYEAILLGRNYSEDAEIRRYLLDYLQEGLGAESFVELAEKSEIDFTEWIELFDKISTPMEAGEMRGITIRMLETYPDHPGMLLARGISESLVKNSEDIIIRDSLLTGIKSARQRYACSAKQINDLCFRLINLCTDRTLKARIPVISLIRKYHGETNEIVEEVFDFLNQKSKDWDTNSKFIVTAVSIEPDLERTILNIKNRSNYHKNLLNQVN